MKYSQNNTLKQRSRLRLARHQNTAFHMSGRHQPVGSRFLSKTGDHETALTSLLDFLGEVAREVNRPVQVALKEEESTLQSNWSKFDLKGVSKNHLIARNEFGQNLSERKRRLVDR